ncbi:response regulator [Epilithonimonas hungarica]|jgi:Response regulator containing a CheY-like receiver domain and an HTH DNA-binding domain|uniref:Two component transcriptional regulator, LuxR family n=1 Tax=Epilithonimonas hungarica TaxID=454006 RepID=A0A1G7J9W0_9FLAO|nr:response regulator transcription factor [Epilithonimonas hungarica]MDP9956204.1 DNA-binding NarL/FixJ family response regulator [Epilithonimonas hungarica]MPT31894.1 response regulator transcription factor [Chryseobacterium sp.]SDF21279.1 two component transcriptional regulator, LuxR family [Epilithonimonas hungarica]
MLSEKIRVLIVDDHQLMIEGLRSLLEDEDSISFVAGATSMQEAMTFLENNKIDVILMDVNMPDSSGIEITKKVKALFPQIKVVALTMHDDISIISKMIKAGASGYVMKRTNMHEVVDALKIVYKDGRYLSPSAQNIIMDNLMSPDEFMDHKEETKPLLSARELEVLKLIAKEYSNEQIGEKLFISERTVEAHRRNIFIKTKTKSIVGLIKYAINEGLVSFGSD